MNKLANQARNAPGYGLAALVMAVMISNGMELTEYEVMGYTIGLTWLAQRIALPIVDGIVGLMKSE